MLLEDVMKGDYRYGWDPEDLWKFVEDKKTITYKTNDVKHWIYMPCWSHYDCFISIFQTIKQPQNFPDHIQRIKKSKLDYPLIIVEDKYDKFGTILDGNHRFAKIIKTNKKTFKVKYVKLKDIKKLKKRIN